MKGMDDERRNRANRTEMQIAEKREAQVLDSKVTESEDVALGGSG